jgi:prolyl-tRNA synthetase
VTEEASLDDVHSGVDRARWPLVPTEGVHQREQHDRVELRIAEPARFEELDHPPAAPIEYGSGVLGEAVVLQRGIEVGQVFYLGTKYSEALKATVLDSEGKERVLEMGCYGIGVTRTIAAAIEQNHDEAGIIWPMPLAPFQVVVVPVNANDERLRTTAERLYADLTARGVEVLLDDRDERPGVKFKDADLIGCPLRITVGPRALERDAVELKRRTKKAATEVAVADVVEHVVAIVKAETAA